MVDPKKAGAAAEKTGSAEGNGLGVPEPSEDDPGPAPPGGRNAGVPLLQRIRRDRADLEAKIDKLRSYIKASSDMMTKIKDVPDMKERYESLAATRADLVQNAVNLQQLLRKLQESESRASLLAGRERALAEERERAARAPPTASDLAELARELPPEEVAELDPEDRAIYEKKLELLKRINQSQEKLRVMEVEQQRLRLMKESVEWKLVEARSNRLSLQERAEELQQENPGVLHPAASATNWESTTASSAADRRALESLDGRLAALLQLPAEQLLTDDGQQLQQRLQQLQQRRQQLDQLSAELEQLRAARDTAPAPPPAAEPDDETQQEPQEEQEQEEQEREEFARSHAADIAAQRRRLQQLEASVADIRSTLQQSSQQQQEQEQERSALQQQQQQFQQQEQRLQHRAREVEWSRRELERLKRLMGAVEAAHSSGRRLCDAVPHQLTELLSGLRQLEQQPAAAAAAADDSHTQASEYVATLQRIQQSVDTLGVAHLNQ